MPAGAAEEGSAPGERLSGPAAHARWRMLPGRRELERQVLRQRAAAGMPAQHHGHLPELRSGEEGAAEGDAEVS